MVSLPGRSGWLGWGGRLAGDAWCAHGGAATGGVGQFEVTDEGDRQAQQGGAFTDQQLSVDDPSDDVFAAVLFGGDGPSVGGERPVVAGEVGFG